jgi:uncharacterized membrane protein
MRVRPRPPTTPDPVRPDGPATFPVEVVALSALMTGAGVMHFITPGFFDKVVPRAFPRRTRRAVTYISGVVEIACGVLLLHPSTRELGAKATAATLIGVFPANIDVVLAGGLPDTAGWAGSRQAAVLRLPLQLPPILAARSIWRDADAAG